MKKLALVALVALVAVLVLTGFGNSPDISDPSPNPLLLNSLSGEPAEGVFHIQNAGNGDLNYHVENATPWLQVGAGQAGVVHPGGTAAIHVRGKCFGETQIATVLSIESNDPDEPFKSLTVVLACPPCPPNTNCWGDPHCITFDGLHYDFQAQGDYLLATNSAGTFVVQERQMFSPVNTKVALTKALAMGIGDDSPDGLTLEDRVVLSLDGPVEVNGVPIQNPATIALDSGGLLKHALPETTVYWPTGEVVKAVRKGSSYIEVSMYLPDTRIGDMAGLLGDFDGDPSNDLTTSDGEVLSQPATVDRLFDPFGIGWAVFSGASLFDDPMMPTKAGRLCLTDVDPAQAADALAQCEAAGVPDGSLRKACALDYLATGEIITVSAPALTGAIGCCCKVCKVGKACGNTCVNANYDCRKPAGCACNAIDP